MEWNRWFAQLPAWGDYGTQKLFVFRKTGGPDMPARDAPERGGV
jgi:hypothetical protein